MASSSSTMATLAEALGELVGIRKYARKKGGG
jgi:hypothetical protein